MGEGRHYRWAAALLFRSQVHAKTEPVRTSFLRLRCVVPKWVALARVHIDHTASRGRGRAAVDRYHRLQVTWRAFSNVVNLPGGN
jgi:hypothetical protein